MIFQNPDFWKSVLPHKTSSRSQPFGIEGQSSHQSVQSLALYLEKDWTETSSWCIMTALCVEGNKCLQHVQEKYYGWRGAHDTGNFWSCLGSRSTNPGFVTKATKLKGHSTKGPNATWESTWYMDGQLAKGKLMQTSGYVFATWPDASSQEKPWCNIPACVVQLFLVE